MKRPSDPPGPPSVATAELAPEPAALLPPRLLSAARGCLLGGALGDALGAPVEFLSLSEIRRRYGPRGIERLEPSSYGPPGRITDDTQMTLFTAEGLIRVIGAWVRGKTRGIGNPPTVVLHAYLRWLHTQGEPWREIAGAFFDPEHPEPDGWLVRQSFLHARRAPGNTCLSALLASRGRYLKARNDSKGCGGVMRVAPVGLLSNAGTGSEPTAREGLFRLAVELAALTHGHPTGQLPAGVLAATIHGIVHEGLTLDRALDGATEILRRWPNRAETLAALEAARELARDGAPSAEKVEQLGAGWVAEEALAIAVYAALSYPEDLRAALLLAVNHSGDSDSTGAICGNLLGAVLGQESLPAEWPSALEGRELIDRIAMDLVAEDQDWRQLVGYNDEYGWGTDPEPDEPSRERVEEWMRRYPGG